MNHEIHPSPLHYAEAGEKREKINMKLYRIFFLKTIFVLLVPFVVKSIYSKESINWLRIISKAVLKLQFFF